MKLIFNLLVIFNFVLSQHLNFNKIEKSIIIPNINNNKIALFFSFQNNNNKLNKYFSSNIWLSENFGFNATIAPNIKEDIIDLYYNTSLSYIPEILSFDAFKTNLSFTIHRQRFYNLISYRWYDLKLVSNIILNKKNIVLCWIYFENIKNKHVIDLSFNKKLSKNIQSYFGSKFYQSNGKINFQPSIKIVVLL